jgi:hypothetical protein
VPQRREFGTFKVLFDKMLGDYLDPERDDIGADQLIKRQLRRWTVSH